MARDFDSRKPIALSVLLAGTVPGQEEETGRGTTGAPGFTITSGNSDTMVADVGLLGPGKRELDELSAWIDGSYAESEGIRSNESPRGTLR